MKKILAMAAAAALAAGASVYAANPFSDVSTSDWAYQAVADLSDQGIVEGYPDGTFKGETHITRYEMAQIIARLMAREDQYNAEQRATIDKLAGEYADELDSLGVRVGNLEKKVGNISWSGDARMRYQNHGKLKASYKGESRKWDAGDSYTGRLRINASAAVNDKVKVEGRFVTNMYFKDAGDDDGDTTMDRIHVVYNPSDTVTLDLGRTGVGLSQTGIYMDEDGVFDGITASYDNGKFNAAAGFGQFKDLGFGIWDDWNEDAWFVKAGAAVGDTAEISAFYLQYKAGYDLHNDWGLNKKDISVWGVGAAVHLTDDLVLDGDYIKNDTSFGGDVEEFLGDGDIWTAGLTYGAVDVEKPGTYSVGLHYVDADRGAMLGSATAWDMNEMFGASTLIGGKFWAAKAGVALAKNVELDAYYYFGYDSKLSLEDADAEWDDTYGIELNYRF